VRAYWSRPKNFRFAHFPSSPKALPLFRSLHDFTEPLSPSVGRPKGRSFAARPRCLRNPCSLLLECVFGGHILGAGGREARRNRVARTTTLKPRLSIPLAAAADADGEEASRLHQPRKRPSLTPLPSPPLPSRPPPPRSFGFRFRLSLAAFAIWQDEKYAIRGEKYQGQQYSHIYFTRLHHMRNLLHALVPSWKPQLPGLCPRSPPLSFLPIPVNLVDKLKSFFVILWSLML
jgi:hypothetical protein